MRTGLVKITHDQRLYVFQVEADLSEPCPCCGVPACGKEYFLYVGKQENKPAIGFDGGLFEVMCEDFVSHNLQAIGYEAIPAFLKEWNEQTGWNSLEDEVVIEGSDVLEALDLMEKKPMSDWLRKDFDQYRETLSGFIKKALEENRELYLLKT